MDDYERLLEISMRGISFSQGVKEAKYKSPQSYVFHSVSVGTLALEFCEEIHKTDQGGKSLDALAFGYGFPDYRSLCYFGGFVHDWNKLEGDVKSLAAYISEKIKVNADNLIYRIAPLAEGPLPDSLHLPLWVSIKLADMLMISDIKSVNDVFYLTSSQAYSLAVKGLNAYGLELKAITSTFRLFTLLASKKIIDKLGKDSRPLISYTDGLIYLSRRDTSLLKLSDIYNLLYSEVYSGEDEALSNIEKCLNSRSVKEKFYTLNNDKSILYREDGKPRQVNEFLPTKICKPFEDVTGRLSNQSKVNVVRRLVEKYRDEIPYGIIIYMIEKFSIKNKDALRDMLNLAKFPSYIEQRNPEELLNAIINAVSEMYKGFTEDVTLMWVVKNSFAGSVMDDLPLITEKPKYYCIVCGNPIFSDNPVRFAQYSDELGGKTEIWNPRERAMAEIDRVRDSWYICPVCHYEANQLKGYLAPPFIIVGFYPGIPVRLLEYLDYEPPQSVNYDLVIDNSDYFSVLSNFGGILRRDNRKSIVDYLASKVLIRSKDVMPKSKISTRLDKNGLNELLRYAPLVSAAYLTSPLFISSNVIEIPMESNGVYVSSTFNYSWMRGESNYVTLLLLLAYRAKAEVLESICRGGDIENCLNALVSESDMFSSVDPALGVISFGTSIGTIEEDSKFFNSILSRARFLNFVLGEVSQMGETIKSSLSNIALVLNTVIKQDKVTKYDVTGFLRDGVEMFFRTSSLSLSKDDRLGIAVNTALSSLENKYTLNDEMRSRVFSSLQDIFSVLYDIENNSDRSLAISISNSIINWLYVLFLYFRRGQK